MVYHSFSFPLERFPFSGLFYSKIRNPLFGFLSLDAEFKQVYACGLLALSVVLFEFLLPDGELSLLSPLGSISLTVFFEHFLGSRGLFFTGSFCIFLGSMCGSCC